VSFYNALEQINTNPVIEKGLTGKGVKIGIIDAGLKKKTRCSLRVLSFPETKPLRNSS
jgi:hypothetical protein